VGHQGVVGWVEGGARWGAWGGGERGHEDMLTAKSQCVGEKKDDVGGGETAPGDALGGEPDFRVTGTASDESHNQKLLMDRKDRRKG